LPEALRDATFLAELFEDTGQVHLPDIQEPTKTAKSSETTGTKHGLRLRFLQDGFEGHAVGGIEHGPPSARRNGVRGEMTQNQTIRYDALR
jgi:hypothetical protein